MTTFIHNIEKYLQSKIRAILFTLIHIGLIKITIPSFFRLNHDIIVFGR